MNSRKEQTVDGTVLSISRRDFLSPEVGRVKGDCLPQGTSNRRAVDLPGEPLSEEMIAEFRESISRGTYDLPAMRHGLAIRLLESGDL